ncbi:PDZ/DHR/GLGF domain containing protein [Bifidobacterium leontopitheci]|uniref:endopeptidase La n=2 Tax=Bifidobacterium leontopitheci TaxID=2650774 RepID=A0A6I1GEN0_9BIFI|nr:PDZ/DHR/GLGF domain containing protein [Bifidobacterium leontopitheci]
MQSKRRLHAHSAQTMLRRALAYVGLIPESRRPLRYYAGTLAVALGIVILLLPSAYTVEGPGPTQDVLGKASGEQVIAVTGATTHKDSGKLLLVTVNASGVPGYPVTNGEALVGWLDKNQTVLPQEVVFPVGQTSEEYAKETSQQMDSSQSAATKAALAYLKHMGKDVSGVKVSMHIDGIGGPSAGMMYTLGVIDKLTGENETGGKTIAGTGTIDAKGTVGAIGGIRLKMIGAKRDGATWFLAPESNCDEVVGHVPQGLTVVKVSTLDEAYKALVAIGKGQTGALEGCSAS